MRVTVDDVRAYLCLGDDNSYDKQLIMLLQAATGYLRGAVDDFDEKYKRSPDFASRADAIVLCAVADLYEHDGKGDPFWSNSVLRSLVSQLQYEEVTGK